MREKLWNISKFNLWATIKINYKMLGWRAVYDMPILVFGAITMDLVGEIKVASELRRTRGVVILGSRHETYYASSGKTQLSVHGVWQVNGRIRIGMDSCIYIGKNAVLSTGSRVYIARDSQVHCMESITIGDGVLMGESYITDSASHEIKRNGVVSSMTMPIRIGDNSYLGFRTMVLKGCVLPPCSVVGSGAVCTRDYSVDDPEGHVLLTGVPAVVKERGVTPVTDVNG